MNEQAQAYGRGRHLEGLQKPAAPMLTQKRLTDVSWTLDKMDDAIAAVSKLLEDEPDQQPPTERAVTMRKIESEMQRLRIDLETLFS